MSGALEPGRLAAIARLTRDRAPQTVTLPDAEGAAIVAYVCDAIGRKVKRFAAADNAAMQAALRDVDFDAMPHGWFVIARKAPKP